MLQGFFPTSVFLDSTCFSPFLGPTGPFYHDPRVMSAQQHPGHCATQPSSQQDFEPPLTRPSRQEKLLLTSAAPVCIHRLPFSAYPSTFNPTTMHPQKTLEIKKNVLAPFQCQGARIVSRMYSNHFPGREVHPDDFNVLLRKELHNRVINTTPDFIYQIFSETRKPLIIDEKFYTALSQTTTNIHGGPCPPLYDKRTRSLNKPAGYSEQHLADWLNLLSKVMGEVHGTPSTRMWSQRSRNRSPVGSNIPRKPDLVLVNKSYDDVLNTNFDLVLDWCFIQAIAEVSAEKKTPSRLIHTINAKSYLMLQCQVNRRFVVSLSFTGDNNFTLTLTDREGQLRWYQMPIFENRKHHDVFFHVFSFLMFGEDSDIGLDPNFKLNDFGKLLEIVVDEKHFVVEKLVYELSCIVGRATRVWIVKYDNKRYVLKDSWIQDHHVDSEIDILQRMTQLTTKHDDIKDSVPRFVCGGDIKIDGLLDCTGRYRKDLKGWPESQRIHRRIVSSPVGEPITSFRSKKEFIQAIISILKGALLCS